MAEKSTGRCSPGARVRGMLFAAALASALFGSAWPAAAQIELSGSLDIAYQHDIAQDAGEANSEVNRSIKGQSPFSLVRSRLFADAGVADNTTVFTTILFDEGLGHFELEGAYVIIDRVGNRDHLNLLIGKMATPFGAFANRSFSTLNPLIGLPLIYHYFSSVRGGNVPGDAAEQIAQRDAASRRGRGLPMIYDACWNTGLQAFGATETLTYAVAVTKGALSNPAAAGNDGAQLLGRVGWQPTMGWSFGLSGGYGPYLEARAALDAQFPAGKSVEDFNQTIFGVDAEYSRGHCQFFLEAVRNSWDVPNVGEALGTYGGYVEGSVAVRSGLHCSLRLGSIVYDKIDNGSGVQTAWDYDVRRVETGLEYYLDRNVRAKAVMQLNFWDDLAVDDKDHMIGAQLATQF